MARAFVGINALAIHYAETSSGIVGECRPGLAWQGYENLLHGGIAATLIDDAMVNCLLKKGITALTASLNVRYYHTIAVDSVVTIEVSVQSQRRQLIQLEATLTVSGKICATGQAKFIEE